MAKWGWRSSSNCATSSGRRIVRLSEKPAHHSRQSGGPTPTPRGFCSTCARQPPRKSPHPDYARPLPPEANNPGATPPVAADGKQPYHAASDPQQKPYPLEHGCRGDGLSPPPAPPLDWRDWAQGPGDYLRPARDRKKRSLPNGWRGILRQRGKGGCRSLCSSIRRTRTRIL
ncbi:MAG: hypothetical protein UZ07_CHB004000119 [Chlorobi bacterium OLB7]|nr:MAG: hypothetical protein UZ07_CHB004000119 [Chlorobi bacterium OLB7]